MSKKILSLLVVLSMLFSIAPMTATVYAAPASVNIFTNGSGSLLPGVTVTIYGNDNFSNGEIYDSNAGVGKYLMNNTGETEAYFQIDLGVAKKITNIKYTALDTSASNWWRNHAFKIMLSNDPEFSGNSEIVTVLDIGQLNGDGSTYQAAGSPNLFIADMSGEGTGTSASVQITDANIVSATDNRTITQCSTPKIYRYVRVQSFRVDGQPKPRLGCAEIEILGSPITKESFGNWSFVDDAGVRTASIPITVPQGMQIPYYSYDVTIDNYNISGEKTTTNTVTTTQNPLSVSIPITDADVRAVVSVKASNNGVEILPPNGYYAVPSVVTGAIPAVINAQSDEEFNTAVSNLIGLGLVNQNEFIDTQILLETGIDEVFDDTVEIFEEDTDVEIEELVEIINTASVLFTMKNGDMSLYNENRALVDNVPAVKEYVEDTLDFSYTLSVDSDVAEGQTGVSNIEQIGAITYTFTQAVDPESLTAENVVVKKGSSVVSVNPARITDTQYVIDKSSLSSDSSYSITFKSGCKTSDGKKMLSDKTFNFQTGTIADMPYKEGCAIKNVALGKNVTGVLTGGSGEMNCIVDGVTSRGDAFSVFTGGANNHLVIDLGDYYDIGSLRYVGPDDGRKYFMSGLVISGSATSSDVTKDIVTLYTSTVGDNDVTPEMCDITEKVNPGQKLRYIRMYNSKRGMFMSEFMAFAYVKTDFGAWTATAFDNNSPAGTYTFSKPINEYNGNNTYYMVLNAYDVNGHKTATKVKSFTFTQTTGVLSENITVPANTVGINAQIVSDLATMKQVTDPITIGAAVTKESAVGNGIAISNEGAKAIMTVAADDNIKKGTRISAVILANSQPGVSAEQNFKNATTDSLGTNTVFVAADVMDTGMKYQIAELPAGRYSVAVSVTDFEGKNDVAYYKFTVVDPEVEADKVGDFEIANPTDILNWVNTELNTTENISKDAIEDIGAINDPDYATFLTYTRDMLYPNGGIENLDAVTNIINATALVDALYDEDNNKAKELMPKCASLLNGKLDVNVNVDKFIDVLSSVKNNITDAASLETTIDKVGMLSYMHGGTNADKAKVLNDYATDFGIDLTLIDTYGITIDRVAEHLDASDASVYFVDGSLNNAYTAAVQSAANEKGSTSDNITNGNQGTASDVVSTGGGGGGGGAPSMPIIPVVTPPTEVSQFNDMSGYAWAQDAVNMLVKKAVVNGYEDGNFKPEGVVTRAEFIKMLAVATQIKVNEAMPMNFIDVEDGSWYFPYIRIAYTNSLCKGVSEYYFNPDGHITRQDMSVMIYNYMKLSGKTAGSLDKDFADADSISSYAVEAVANATASGVITGYEDSTFRPMKNATRAEAAVIISRILN